MMAFGKTHDTTMNEPLRRWMERMRSRHVGVGQTNNVELRPQQRQRGRRSPLANIVAGKEVKTRYAPCILEYEACCMHVCSSEVENMSVISGADLLPTLQFEPENYAPPVATGDEILIR